MLPLIRGVKIATAPPMVDEKGKTSVQREAGDAGSNCICTVPTKWVSVHFNEKIDKQ
jgi:hypothetical protein